jgi:hypothetical protein
MTREQQGLARSRDHPPLAPHSPPPRATHLGSPFSFPRHPLIQLRLSLLRLLLAVIATASSLAAVERQTAFDTSHPCPPFHSTGIHSSRSTWASRISILRQWTQQSAYRSSISILQIGHLLILPTSILRHHIRARTHEVQDGCLDLPVCPDCFQHLACEFIFHSHHPPCLVQALSGKRECLNLTDVSGCAILPIITRPWSSSRHRPGRTLASAQRS